MSLKQKDNLVRIIITSVIFSILFALEHLGVLDRIGLSLIKAFIFIVPYMFIGYDIIIKAIKNIRHGQIFDENFLMLIATLGAFGTGEYPEAVAVMLFYQIGELFQSYAVEKSRQSISDMMDICPEYANIVENGELKQVDPEDVEIGSVIIVKSGERIPLDGIVTEGETMLDTAALTGESVPRKVSKGDEVFSGCINGYNTIKIKVTKAFEDSTVSKILELVENASSKKAKVENFITRFAKYYTPIVTICAALLAVIPPIIFSGDWGLWIHRACIFLVISCPCALVISVPMGFFGGIGAASKIGVLIKGSNYLESVAELSTVVFDKTGTLTKGEFKVASVISEGIEKEKLLELAAYAENYSTHPIANSIREAYGKPVDSSRIGEFEEIPGCGIHTVIDGHDIYIGNYKLIKRFDISLKEFDDFGTIVYIVSDKVFVGAIVISDSVKSMAKDAIQNIKNEGIKSCVMLTGDRKKTAYAIAEQLNVDEVRSELLPEDKVSAVEELMLKQRKNERLAFVGDGINDAPVLMRADVGFAMGSMGSDAAIEAADIVIMDDDISKIASVIRIARKTLSIVKQNIVFALSVKALVLLLGALGVANMWEAVFADVGVSVIAILNSMRTLNTK